MASATVERFVRLFRKRGNAIAREALVNEVLGVPYYGTTRTLVPFIVKLRKKVGEVPGAAAFADRAHIGWSVQSDVATPIAISTCRSLVAIVSISSVELRPWHR